MAHDDLQDATQNADPLIDEVRRIRRTICERTGHDLDRLAAELRAVEQDYAARRGVFAKVNEEAAARVQASWGDMTGPGQDPLIDEIRSIRQSASHERRD